MKYDRLLADLRHRIGEVRDQVGDARPYHADPDSGLWQTGDAVFAEGAKRHLDITIRDFIRGNGVPARMQVENNDASAQEFTRHLEPMIDGLMTYMRQRGRLVGGCFNQPRAFANKSELIWGTAYLLMALGYLKQGRVIC